MITRAVLAGFLIFLLASCATGGRERRHHNWSDRNITKMKDNISEIVSQMTTDELAQSQLKNCIANKIIERYPDFIDFLIASSDGLKKIVDKDAAPCLVTLIAD